MVRKRGPFDRIEKVVSKKRPVNPAEEEKKESPSKKSRNVLNDHILSLYRKEATSRESSFSNHHSTANETEMHTSDAKTEQSNSASTLSKSSRKSMKLVEKKINPGFTIIHPTVTFKDVAGLDEILNELLRAYLRIRDPKVFATLNPKQKNRYLFLHGPSGCGKTHVVHAVAGELGLPLLEVSTTGLVNGVSGESESRIRDVFDEALRIAPCILFLDRIDTIASKIDSRDSRGMERRMVTQFIKCLDDFRTDTSSKVLVIAASNKLDSIDSDLLNKFHKPFVVKTPDEKARLMILQVLTKHMNLPPNCDLEWLAHHTPGYVGADLYNLVDEASRISANRLYDKFICEQFENEKCESNANSHDESYSEANKNTVLSYCKSELELPIEERKLTAYTLERFQEAIKRIVPSSKREGFCMVPTVTWEDVGALQDIKEELQETIIWPVKFRQLYEKFGMESAKGILLYGPKGCGKTLLAKVVANECSINFLSVKGPELLNMYLGESERAVRQCFQRAKNSAPCVIFFDEIDALCPERTGSNGNAAAERVVNMLLTEMDGMEDRNEVFVIGATNRLEKIDSAMLRPGRLEKIIYIGLPTPDDRVDILKSLTKNKTKPKISDDVDLNAIGHDSRCNNFSGADLAHLIRTAIAHAIKDHIKSSSTNDIGEIKLSNFEHAFSTVKPSVTKKDIKYFQRVSEKRQ